MKNVFKLLLIPLLFLTACNNNQTESSEPSSESIKVPIEIEATNEYEKEDVIIHRDYSSIISGIPFQSISAMILHYHQTMRFCNFHPDSIPIRKQLRNYLFL